MEVLSTAQNTVSPAPEVVGCLIAGQPSLTLEGAKSVLEGAPGIAIVGLASTEQAALDLLHDRHPELLVLDLASSDQESLKFVREVRSRFPRVAILALAEESDAAFAREL